MFEKMKQFGIMDKTGIDVPGEAGTIMHKQENVGTVELATMSFGQSFQLSPIRMLTSIAQIINGGRTITPHFGVSAVSSDGKMMKKFSYDSGTQVLSEEKSKEICEALGKVVEEGGGKNAAVSGYMVGGKTGTSQKLPRGSGKYIASCVGFSPVENPQVIAMVRIDEPQGLYYGGVIAAPAISSIYTNILPYLFDE
jgi:stage V sporulation protein D (sporulation-specific penicillin-binding protein)